MAWELKDCFDNNSNVCVWMVGDSRMTALLAMTD